MILSAFCATGVICKRFGSVRIVPASRLADGEAVHRRDSVGMEGDGVTPAVWL